MHPPRYMLQQCVLKRVMNKINSRHDKYDHPVNVMKDISSKVTPFKFNICCRIASRRQSIICDGLRLVCERTFDAVLVSQKLLSP